MSACIISLLLIHKTHEAESDRTHSTRQEEMLVMDADISPWDRWRRVDKLNSFTATCDSLPNRNVSVNRTHSVLCADVVQSCLAKDSDRPYSQP